MSKKNRKNRSSGKTGRSSRTVRKQSANKADQLFQQLNQRYLSNPDDLTTSLEMAEYYRSHGRDREILDILKRHESSYPIEDPHLRHKFDRLFAYGHSFSGNFVDAEQVIDRGLKDVSHSPDLLYLLCFVRLSLRHYDESVNAGESYLAVLDQIRESQVVPDNFSLTKEHLSQLCNFLATAHREKREFDPALQYYEKSIEANPQNQLPYLNLVAMHRYRGDIDMARRIINNGIKLCPQVQELRIMAQSLDRSASVSACMIVKNEEEMLAECLDSIRDWVNEIIIVDTGSTDRTVEIAESYGAKIFHQPWEGDFSRHRNHSIEQASADWIFIIDADERVVAEDVPKLLDILNRGEYPMISINVINEYGEEGSTRHTTTFLPSVRLFKSELNLRYEGIVHNRLKLPPDLEIARAEVKVRHLGYDLSQEKMRRKAERTKELLKKQLRENPDDAFALFNYAQVLRGEGTEKLDENGGEIIRSATRAVELTDPNNPRQRSIHLSCLDQIAWTAFYTGDYKTAVEKCEWALRLKPDYLDPILLMGHIYSRQRDFELGTMWYKKYLEAQARFDHSKETDSIILIHPDSRAVAYYGLAMIAEATGNKDKAKQYYLQTLKVNPAYLEANGGLGRILKEELDFAGAEKYLRKQLETDTKTYDAALNLADILYNRREYDRAKDHYNLAINLNSEGAEAFIGLGRLYFETGSDNEGLDCFSKVRKMGASSLEINRKLAQTVYRLARYAEAAEIYEEIINQTEPDSELLNELANCFFKQDNYDKAEQFYVKASEVSPVAPEVYYNLGATRARLKKYKEAIISLERYSDVSPENSEIFFLIGDLYSQTEDYSASISSYEKHLRSNPTNVAALCRLSECYSLMGHRDAAILGYQQALKIDPDCDLARQSLDRLTEPFRQA